MHKTKQFIYLVKAVLLIVVLSLGLVKSCHGAISFTVENWTAAPQFVGSTNGSTFVVSPNSSVVLLDWSGLLQAWDTNSMYFEQDTAASPFSGTRDQNSTVQLVQDTGALVGLVTVRETGMYWFYQGLLFGLGPLAFRIAISMARMLGRSTPEGGL